MNKVTLMGRTTANVELKKTQNGVSVASFTLAVNRRYVPQGQERQADFIDCVAWRGTAEFIAKWFSKGDMIAVVGEIQTRNYEDKNGNKRKAVEVVIDEAHFCGSKATQTEQSNTSAPDAMPDYGDDLPF